MREEGVEEGGMEGGKRGKRQGTEKGGVGKMCGALSWSCFFQKKLLIKTVF